MTPYYVYRHQTIATGFTIPTYEYTTENQIAKIIEKNYSSNGEVFRTTSAILRTQRISLSSPNEFSVTYEQPRTGIIYRGDIKLSIETRNNNVSKFYTTVTNNGRTFRNY